MKQLKLIAVHGKGFDHEIVDMATGAHVAKVFAWESDSFELAQLLAAAPRLLQALIAADAALRAHPGGDNRSNDDAQLAIYAIAQTNGQLVSLKPRSPVVVESFSTYCTKCQHDTLHSDNADDTVTCRTCGFNHDVVPF